MVRDPHSDLRLVQSALGGDRQDLRLLTDRLRFVPRLLAVRNRRFGDPLTRDDLADLSQDVVVIVLRKLGEYRGECGLDGWLYRIAVLEFMNALRRAGRSRTMVTADSIEISDDGPAATFDDVHACLDRVDERQAEVIRLKHFEDLTFESIGHRLGIPSSTAKTRYYDGLRALAPMLDERRTASP